MKNKLIQVLNALGRRSNAPDAGDEKIQDALQKSARRLRVIDTQTQQQWSRLQSTLQNTPQNTIERANTEVVPFKPRLMPRLAFGAVALAIILAAVFLFTSGPQLAPDTFATQMGEQKEIVLGDGSQVTLSYASELVASQQRADNPRRFSLTGEAYFRVRHTGTPFIVSTQYADVEVVGTEFNVRERNGEFEIGVIDGAVKMRVVKEGKDSTLMLTRHQMGACLENGFPGRLANISSTEYPGWMHGKLLLDKTSFSAACRELEMRFGIIISIHDRLIQDKIITGILDARNAELGLAALCELTGKKFTHSGRTYDVE